MWQRLPDTGGLKSMNKIEDAFKNKKSIYTVCYGRGSIP